MSAAALHGIPLLQPQRSRVHLTSGKTSGGKTTKLRHLHAAPLDPGDVTVVDGVAVTSVGRTAVDVACSGNFAQALTVFDGALRAEASREEMAVALRRRRAGARPARRALPLADRASESVGESWSRAQMIQGGLPTPVLQRRFHCASGRSYRCDFCWGDKLIGEFDGAVKYGRLRRSGESVADAVVREKQREDELRSMGFMVVRWTWGMLESGGMLDLLHAWLTRLDLMPT
ncbi:hypothetical protein [Gordonia araii]|uniref:hypothetical protein n=1 Tax=Gordonia araii TaxID=263909 RepID=UPI00277D0C11|nr:hypothetical protein [Gordonia araii]